MPPQAAAPQDRGLWTESVDRLRDIASDLFATLPNLVIGLLVFALAWFAGRAIRSAVRRVTARRRKHRNLAIVLGRVAHGVLAMLGFLTAAVIVFPTFTPGRLIEVLGLGSVAAGFAFRDILQNYLAGILLLTTEPFRVDDQIVYREFEGTVEDIQTRATFIRTYDGRRVVIPNAELFNNPVQVNTAFESRRIEYDFGIGYGDDIALARGIVLDTVQRCEGVLNDPAPDCLVYAYAESGVTLRIRWWIRPPRRTDDLETRDRVLESIKSALLSHGIDLPFPTQQVLFHDQTEETDGDRSRQREGWPADRGGARPPRPAGIADAITRAAPRTSPSKPGSMDANGPGTR